MPTVPGDRRPGGKRDPTSKAGSSCSLSWVFAHRAVHRVSTSCDCGTNAFVRSWHTSIICTSGRTRPFDWGLLHTACLANRALRCVVPVCLRPFLLKIRAIPGAGNLRHQKPCEIFSHQAMARRRPTRRVPHIIRLWSIAFHQRTGQVGERNLHLALRLQHVLREAGGWFERVDQRG